jgi:hypothetical protein
MNIGRLSLALVLLLASGSAVASEGCWHSVLSPRSEFDSSRLEPSNQHDEASGCPTNFKYATDKAEQIFSFEKSTSRRTRKYGDSTETVTCSYRGPVDCDQGVCQPVVLSCTK